MDAFAKRLDDYGIKGYLWENKLEPIVNYRKIFEEASEIYWGETFFFRLLGMELELQIKDIEKFKINFNIPKEFHLLDGVFFKSMDFQVDEEENLSKKIQMDYKGSSFFLPNDLKISIGRNDAFYTKQDKKYALEKIFNQKKARENLAERQKHLAEKFLTNESVLRQVAKFQLEMETLEKSMNIVTQA